jgi:hypothetical protein
MPEPKTKRNDADVDAFLATVQDDRQRADAGALRDLLADVTGDAGAMWGSSIVGFGSQHHEYSSGRQGEWMAIGFSPRKANLTLYIMDGFDAYDDLLGRLGKHTTGKSCLYVKRLADVDLDVLRQLVHESYSHAVSQQPRP